MTRESVAPPEGRLPPWHRVVEWAGLLALLAFMGALVIPAHWTSIWMDREFTGYVAPIANRIAAGQRLYDDGAHLPIPPLSFVVLRGISAGHATWIWESATNAIAQSLILMTLYTGLSRHFRFPLPLLATLCATPIFFALPKTILYDAMAQFLGAVGMVGAAGLLLASPRGSDRSDPSVRMLLFLSVVGALCFLTKQSTGAGLIGGTSLSLLVLLPADVVTRARAAATYVVLSLLAVVAGAFALSPFVSVAGMLEDVILTGSEPKGGVDAVVSYLPAYAGQIRLPLLGAGLLAIFWWVFAGRRSGRPVFEEGPRSMASWDGAARPVVYGTVAAAISATLFLLLASAGRPTLKRLLTFVWTTWSSPVLYGAVLPAGLMLAFSFAFLSSARRDVRPRAIRALGTYAVMAIPVAVAHSLSVPFFRWSYENNPLIVVALACVLAPLCASWERSRFPSGRWWGALAAALALVATSWTALYPQMEAINSCTESWPEVRHLAGARLRPRADGMRQVTRVVRELAPGANDRVLLLPEDPNVQEWFERPRPFLSAAIVFSEAYWDRYVDRDFARLARDPPKVLVIGPEPHWRTFHHIWHRNWGAERLIDRVERELLPARYQLSRVIPIRRASLREEMRVFVRVESAQPNG